MSSVTSQKRFIPTMSCLDPDRGGVDYALQNIEILVKNGADGIFLLGGNLHYLAVIDIYKAVRERYPDLWIGINFFDLVHDSNWSKLEHVVLRRTIGLNGLWLDSLPLKKSLDVFTDINIFSSVFMNNNDVDDVCLKIKRYGYIPIVMLQKDFALTRNLPQVTIAQSAQGSVIPIAMFVDTTEDISSLLEYANMVVFSEEELANPLVAVRRREVESFFDSEKVLNIAKLIHAS